MNWTTKKLFIEYKKTTLLTFCCSCFEFGEMWDIEEKREKIKEKAKLFIQEKDLKDWVVPEHVNGKASFIFERKDYNGKKYHSEEKEIRTNFLKWCIEKGYKDIDSLFN